MTLPPPDVGSVAVVTGASSGIGMEFSRQLAELGHGLILVARRKDRLTVLADELRRKHDVRVDVLASDLGDRSERNSLLAAVETLGVHVDILVNCAGFGSSGPFLASELDRTLAMVRTNIEAVMFLTGAFVGPMVERGRGAILIVSSLAGFAPTPGSVVYSATKAASLSFSEGLHAELRPHGVSVTALCPGPVRTEFLEIAELDGAVQQWPNFLIPTAAECAKAGLDGLARGRRVVVPNRGIRAMALASRTLPHGVWLSATRLLMRT